MILLVAVRNLVNNLKHTLIIMALMTLIIMLFFIGNTILAASGEGLRRTYILNYTGDVVVMAPAETSMSLFGSNTPAIGEFFSIPVLKGHQEIIAAVNAMEGVDVVTSQLSGPVALDAAGARFATIAFGIEAESYFRVFPGIRLLEGSFLKTGERGAMITEGRAREIETATGKPVSPGDMMLFTTAGATGFKIREVPLVGVFSYSNAGQIPDQITLLDSQTLRALNSILLASREKDAAPASATDILTDDIDSLFGDADPDTNAESSESVSLEGFREELSRPDGQNAAPVTEGSWNFIVIRLKQGVPAGPFIERLNDTLKPLSAVAVDWITAAGAPAMLVTLLFYIFNGGLMLLVIAGMIAIINVLLITVFQRAREIGTLRAIGASSHFIRGLVFSENLIISLCAGVLGVIFGVIIITIVNTAGIRVSNSLIVAMVGQDTVHIGFSGTVAAVSLLGSLVLGFVSSLYPVAFTLRIQPIEAVSKG